MAKVHSRSPPSLRAMYEWVWKSLRHKFVFVFHPRSPPPFSQFHSTSLFVHSFLRNKTSVLIRPKRGSLFFLVGRGRGCMKKRKTIRVFYFIFLFKISWNVAFSVMFIFFFVIILRFSKVKLWRKRQIKFLFIYFGNSSFESFSGKKSSKEQTNARESCATERFITRSRGYKFWGKKGGGVREEELKGKEGGRWGVGRK